MKNIYTLLLLSIFGFQFSSAQYTWTQKANLGVMARSCAISFTVGGSGYAGTGLNSNGTVLGDFWAYDTLTNAWTQKADYGGGTTFNAAAFAIGSKGYAGLGSAAYPSYNFVQDWWEYDPVANTWTQKGNFPGAGRYTPAYFVIGNKAYMGTGWSPLINDWWEYDAATDVWTQKGNFAGGFRQATVSFSIGNKGYVGAGANGSTVYNDFWEYDPSTDTWTQKANIPVIRDAGIGFTIGGYGFVGLGTYSYPQLTFLKDFYSYDPSADAWTQIVDFAGSARYSVFAFSFPGSCRAYVGTGEDGPTFQSLTNDFWEFSIDSCNGVTAPPPVASFQSSDSAFCANNCIGFTDHSANATSWLWSFPGGIPSSSTDQDPQTVCYLNGGTFNVTLVAVGSGGSDTLNLPDYITVFPAPVTPIIVQSNDTLYCSTDPAYASYQWYINDTIARGATDTLYIQTQNGNYNVAVTDTNGCQISVGVIILGLNEVEENSSFTLYPNPATNQLTIRASSLSLHNEAVTVSVMNVLGQETSPPTPLLEERGDALIDISALPAGMYFLQIKTECGSVVKEFVKE